ncbi:4-hydroxybenzoate 3-monooxygenase [Streptacidiphilus griseoplanus]|uniref:4-hydroxybenzoate 3-monooxygenase n=1 Tax=Peterkaempfera griseoplana TaxID=66896 RepID=UPI001FE15731|nr:4-hydroxybenzoate 3-monooxygenase [Peterkaempfera griseoplana]
MVSQESTAVLIIGAGPAGLVLGNLLLAAGVDCTVVERQSRAHVEQRARAGFLAAHTVRVLTEHGLADGLHTYGQQHDVCAFRTDAGEFQLAYGMLGRGEAHTVYPQQDLVRDLVAEFLARGGDLRFETAALRIDGLDGDRPSVAALTPEGSEVLFSARFVAGCDGQHGIARSAVPPGAVRRYRRDHGVSWLALLAAAPQSMAAVAYAVHRDGFAGHMARSPEVTRYYLQCEPGTDPQSWTHDRIWAELHHRMRADRHGPLRQGEILERRVVDMRSDVLDPIQYGPLFLVGDAAGLISPAAAKGANLAVMESEVLARALAARLGGGDEQLLARYSADCLPRIWRAQEFSHWMINLLHGPSGDDDEAVFLRALQHARLESLRDSRRHQDHFAENYVGI